MFFLSKRLGHSFDVLGITVMIARFAARIGRGIVLRPSLEVNCEQTCFSESTASFAEVLLHGISVGPDQLFGNLIDTNKGTGNKQHETGAK